MSIIDTHNYKLTENLLKFVLAAITNYNKEYLLILLKNIGVCSILFTKLTKTLCIKYLVATIVLINCNGNTCFYFNNLYELY